MVWKEAMPDYGIFQITCSCKNLYLEGPIEVEVWLPPNDAQSPSFSMRMQTTRALLNTCRESRVELHHHLPQSIKSVREKLRIHGSKDTIYLHSMGGYVVETFGWGSLGSLPLMFEDGWNLLPRKVAIHS